MVGWAPEGQAYSQFGINQYWLETENDGDAIPDDWERNGICYSATEGAYLPQSTGVERCAGKGEFIDLPAMGADPSQPDIFVHIDWVDSGSSYKLSQQALDLVSFAFEQRGIRLHIDQGPDSNNYPLRTPWGALSRARSVPSASIDCTAPPPSGQNTNARQSGCNWGGIDAVKNAVCQGALGCGFNLTGRSRVFHYAISLPQQIGNRNSGVARDDPNRLRFASSDFVLSLGPWVTKLSKTHVADLPVLLQAGTFMHELGHNLGLRHGGGDDEQYKPNYLSVMNYLFQGYGVMSTIQPNAYVDYSFRSIPTIRESNIDETLGWDAEFGNAQTWFFCEARAGQPTVTPPTPVGPYVLTNSIDWNCDGAMNQQQRADVNTGPDMVGTYTDLAAFDDWSNLIYTGGNIGRYGLAPALPSVTLNEEFYTPELYELLEPPTAIEALN